MLNERMFLPTYWITVDATDGVPTVLPARAAVRSRLTAVLRALSPGECEALLEDVSLAVPGGLESRFGSFTNPDWVDLSALLYAGAVEVLLAVGDENDNVLSVPIGAENGTPHPGDTRVLHTTAIFGDGTYESENPWPGYRGLRAFLAFLDHPFAVDVRRDDFGFITVID